MKNLLKFTIIILVLFIQNELFSQTSPLLKFDPEPFKPFYFEHDALKGLSKPEIINGKLVWIEETKAEYEKRNAEHKRKLYSDFTKTTEYKKWFEEHLEWRKNNPNWKEITRYPELLSQSERQALSKPKPIIGESYNVTSNTLNIRLEPNKNSAIITTLKIGDELKLLNADNEDWWLIKNDNVQGYVFSQFLKIDPYSGWEKKYYPSGATTECENVTPKYDYKVDNYLKINVGSGTDVVVKLMKKGSYEDECIRIVYVRSSDSYVIRNIPGGLYYLKIAYGKDYRQKIVDNQCYAKFMQNAQYEKGVEILDFNKIKQPDKRIGNEIYENWSVPSFELSLDVIVTKGTKSAFKSSDISEAEFNK
jgi:hypothetical protein